MKKVYIFSLTILMMMVILSGCGEGMVKWSESARKKMEDTGENMGNKIREKGDKITEKIDSMTQDLNATNEKTVKTIENKQDNSVQSTNSPEAKPTETPKIEEQKEKPLGWNKDDTDVMSNGNTKYAVKLLTDNEYKFSKYTYAEQFNKLTKQPSTLTASNFRIQMF